MNNKLKKIITLFNHRKAFFNKHPELYRFIKQNLGTKMPEETKISIIIQRPNEQKQEVEFTVEEQDKEFLEAFSDILN